MPIVICTNCDFGDRWWNLLFPARYNPELPCPKCGYDKTPHWEKEFDYNFGSYEALYEKREPNDWILKDDIKSFIRQQLEKLIADIPEGCGDITCDVTDCIEPLKAQLRKDYL